MPDIKEEWRDIEGYEGLYQVSNLGRVRSLRNTRGRLLEPPKIKALTKDHSGYCTVSFSVNCKRKTYKVHRLVATAFISNPENKPQVNHINGIKTDNCVSNLEWCTAHENMSHAFAIGLNKSLKGENSPKAQLTNAQVEEIRKIYKKRDKKFGCKALSEKYGVSQSIINYSVLNKTYVSEEYKANTSKRVTQKEVEEIRKIYNNKDKKNGITALAKKFNVSPCVVRDIVKNKTYKNAEYKSLPMTKLNKKEIDEIRKAYVPRSNEFNMYSLAKKYNVSATRIWCIIHSEDQKQEN